MPVSSCRLAPLLAAVALIAATAAVRPSEAPAQAVSSGVSGGFFSGDGGRRGGAAAAGRSITDPFGRSHVPGAFGGNHVPGAFGGPALLNAPGEEGRRDRKKKRKFRRRPGAVTPFPFLLAEPAIFRRTGVIATAARRAREEAGRTAAERAEVAAARAELAAERARLETARAEESAEAAAPAPPAAPPSEAARDVGRALKAGGEATAGPEGPRGCALVRVRTPTGIGMRQRIYPGEIGAGDPAEAARLLRDRVRAGEPLILPGPDGKLTLPASLVDGLIVGPC